MSLLKQIGIEFIIAFLVVALFIMYILRIKKTAKDEGKIEQKIIQLKAQQETIERASRAKREFGTTIEVLEDNDHAQFKDKVNYKDAKIKNISPDRCVIECVQFGRSPFRRNR